MLLIDANAILRYILFDDEDMANNVRELLGKSRVTVRIEVLAEVVYVLSKVYKMPKLEIAACIERFLEIPFVETEDNDVLVLALKTYATANLDFVDCILYGFHVMRGYDVFTFDKKLNSMIVKDPFYEGANMRHLQASIAEFDDPASPKIIKTLEELEAMENE